MDTNHDLEVRVVDFAKARETVLGIRFEVFVEEQGVSPELEQDEFDEGAIQVLAKRGGAAVGVGRMLRDGHIGRLAVRRPYRGQGIGRAIMRALMAEGERTGVRRFLLAAQTHATGFYEALGFERYGPIYWEAGIEHTDMCREAKAKMETGGDAN